MVSDPKNYEGYVQIAPSVLSADFANLGEQVKQATEAVSYTHLTLPTILLV